MSGSRLKTRHSVLLRVGAFLAALFPNVPCRDAQKEIGLCGELVLNVLDQVGFGEINHT